MTRESHNTFKRTSALVASNKTADANGVSLDTKGYESVELAVNVGVSGDTLSGSLYIELEVEHADDNGSGSPGTFTDVADVDLTNVVVGTNPGTFAKIDDPAEDDAVYSVGYIGQKQWIRVVANITGTHTNGTPSAGVAILGHARHNPPA